MKVHHKQYKYLSQIRRQLQRVYATAIVADNYNGVTLVKAHMCELRSFNNFLLTERFVLVLSKVKNVNLCGKIR